MADFDVLTDEDVSGLIAAATDTEFRATELASRRRRMIEALAQLVDAEAGHWAWGCGHPLASEIMPVAIIDCGYSDQQRTTMIEHAMHPDSIATFQSRVAKRMNGSRRITVTRRDILPDDEWRSSPHWIAYVERLGLDSWIHAVNYHRDDHWCCIHLLRATGNPEFGPREAALTSLALRSIAWLRPLRGETHLLPEPVTKLTPRQRTVMLLLLDGLPRKEIAGQLAISEHTVDDHLKAIYANFNVRSVGELAAKFLKMA